MLDTGCWISAADFSARISSSIQYHFFISMELRVKRAPRIDIEITVPGDKSISHRAVIIAALSNGPCTLRGFLPSEDCMHTVNAMRALGVKIEKPDPHTMSAPRKKRGFRPPNTEITCANS